MSDRKSRVDVDFYVSLFENVLCDAYACYPEIPSHERERDMESVRRRVASEGFQFLSVQLPILGKAVDRALELGELTVPAGFSRKTKAGVRWNIPKLFSALFLTAFTQKGSLTRERGSAIPFIRQLCFLCYKVQMPFKEDAMEKASTKFRQLDEGLNPVKPELKANPVFRYARLMLQRLFAGFDPSNVVPRHGPGAVAERLQGRNKYCFSNYVPEIDQLYPYATFVSYGILTENVTQMTEHLTWARGPLPPSRVCLVPKDSRGPRIIAAEPALLQYLQQGLGRAVIEHVERHPLTKRRVYFTDQSVHRNLALQASKNRRLATLDLKDASDRVSLELVESLFPDFLLPYLKALRSQRAQLPTGEIVELKKFAPMGSALCFPIEALVFWALASGVVWSENRRRASNPQPVFVYGDDLIVPTRYAEAVIAKLETYGVLFNRDKCCIQGYFRESCGMDAFLGEDVTPVKLKTLVLTVPHRRLTNLVALNENANAFFDKGYWRTADFLDKYVEKWWGPIPTTDWRFTGLSRRSHVVPTRTTVPKGCRVKWCADLQEYRVRTLTLRAREVSSPFPSDVCRLGHNLYQGVSQPYADEVAVSHSARPTCAWNVI